MKTVRSARPVAAAATPKQRIGGRRLSRIDYIDDEDINAGIETELPETREESMDNAEAITIPSVTTAPAKTENVTTVAAADSEESTTVSTRSCTPCSDTPSPYMIATEKKCEDFNLMGKCNEADNWKEERYCSKTCYEIRLGYDGDYCCPTSTSTEPTVAAPTTDAPTTTTPSPKPTLIPTSAYPTMEWEAGDDNRADITQADPETHRSEEIKTSERFDQDDVNKEDNDINKVDTNGSKNGEIHKLVPASTSAPTTSPTLLPTSVPTATPTPSIKSIEADDDKDVIGEERLDLPEKASKGKGASAHKHRSKSKHNSGDEIQSHGDSMSNLSYSPGCNAIQRGKLYNKGEEVTVGFKYMVVYDTDLNLSDLLIELEQHLQAFAEESMINCPGATYVVNNGRTYIDGVHIDLPSQPAAGCGGVEGSLCTMLDGYATIYVREAPETSGLAATQDALKALRLGMSDELIDGTEGITSLSFLGGITAEGDGLGTSGVADKIPASARISDAPQGNVQENDSLSVLGIVFVMLAVVCFVLIGAALRRRVRFKLNKRALADSDSEESLSSDIRPNDEDGDKENMIETQGSMAQSIAESMAASCHGNTAAACGAEDSDDDSIAEVSVNQFPLAAASMDGGGKQTISIHQYCEAPSCTICRSYKKPMFADLKYKVDEAEQEKISSSNTSGGAADCHHDACPKGLVATALSRFSSGGDCYLCT